MTDNEQITSRDGAGAFLARMAIEAPSALIVAEAETGTVVAVNEAATVLFDRSRSSLIGADQTELHPPGGEARYREGFNTAVEDEETTVYADEDDAIRIQRRDGTVVPVDVRSTTITHQDTDYVVGVFQDARDRLERRERLERQATAMDISPSGIGLLNADGEYTYLNEAHVSMFGYDSDTELLGGTWRQFYDDRVAARIESEVLPVVKAEGTWDGELVGQRKDGSPITQRVALSTLPDGGLACVNVDLTERERTRERIEETRELVETVMTAADRESVIEIVIDAISAIVDRPFAGYWRHDEATESLVPVEISEPGQAIVDTVPTFHSGASIAYETFKSGVPEYCADVPAEPLAHNPDSPIGSEFIVPIGDDGALLVASPSRDDIPTEDRELVVIIARHLQTALTLADRRQRLQDARARIEAERNQLKRVIDTVPQLIFAKNTDGEFILANEAVADAYGTTIQDLIGSTDADFSADPNEVDAFTEDDRRVIETGEALHRRQETLTDADGTERILETWKIPFTPVDDTDPAVLGVANDVTELTQARAELKRQRQLTNLYTVSNRVLQASTPAEAFDVCVDAVADVVSNDSVAIYVRDDDHGALVRRAAASDVGFPARIDPGDGEAWRVFGDNKPQWIATDQFGGTTHHTSDELLAVSLDDTGVLVVSVTEPDAELESFIGAVARQVTAALTQLRQQRSIRDLSDDVAETRQLADQYRQLWEAVIGAVESIAVSRTPEAVFDAVVQFGEQVAAYTFVGTYDSVVGSLEPAKVSAAGGPGKLYDRAERFPALVAAETDEVQRAVDDRHDEYDEWITQLLYFGYRSSVAVPLSHRGTVHAVAEFTSTSVDAFEGDRARALSAVGEAAGMRLAAIEAVTASGEVVTFDIECRDPTFLFPDLPRGGSIMTDNVVVTGDSSVFIEARTEGYAESVVRDYVARTPGLELEAIHHSAVDVFDVELRAVETGQTQIGTLLDTLDRANVRLIGVRARPDATVFGLETPDSTQVSAIRNVLADLCETASLVSKRQRAGATRTADDTDTANLTERQREVLEAALRQGYYDDPRQTSGSDLADRFELSSSTLHQHLRAAESKIIRQFFDS